MRRYSATSTGVASGGSWSDTTDEQSQMADLSESRRMVSATMGGVRDLTDSRSRIAEAKGHPRLVRRAIR
jgi:hypothetical protein